jgi:hypothetical protein
MIPLEQFICDTCNQIIENYGDGAIEWISPSDENGKQLPPNSFRICHKNSNCYSIYKKVAFGVSRELVNFSDKMKIIELLGMIDKEYFPFDQNSLNEYIELFRRLTIPYYEEARQYWHEADNEGLIENKITCYQENNLEKIINRFK